MNNIHSALCLVCHNLCFLRMDSVLYKFVIGHLTIAALLIVAPYPFM